MKQSNVCCLLRVGKGSENFPLKIKLYIRQSRNIGGWDGFAKVIVSALLKFLPIFRAADLHELSH